ncbi:hypothetical protein FRX31_031669 [Thalictrum thalictroides]|uniref:CCHC-type domain-containing protein n=1 Tax=Thalictrum thalictroides TaxID=46969 RepID=A0A7J6V1A0_THATH|nr:hypothetical protein FRX31_031669 [Thalictrum thalictroides]
MGYINPMPDMQDWTKPETTTILPPPFVRGIGRPKKLRKLDEEDEGRRGSKKVRFCRACGGPGHYSKNCKGPAAPPKMTKKKGKKSQKISTSVSRQIREQSRTTTQFGEPMTRTRATIQPGPSSGIPGMSWTVPQAQGLVASTTLSRQSSMSTQLSQTPLIRAPQLRTPFVRLATSFQTSAIAPTVQNPPFRTGSNVNPPFRTGSNNVNPPFRASNSFTSSSSSAAGYYSSTQHQGITAFCVPPHSNSASSQPRGANSRHLRPTFTTRGPNMQPWFTTQKHVVVRGPLPKPS